MFAASLVNRLEGLFPVLQLMHTQTRPGILPPKGHGVVLQQRGLLWRINEAARGLPGVASRAVFPDPECAELPTYLATKTSLKLEQ
jgi:hypothetical protein